MDKKVLMITSSVTLLGLVVTSIALLTEHKNETAFAINRSSNRTLVISTGADGNLYCKNPNKSGSYYTYYTMSSEGTKFLVYSTKLFQEGLSEGDKVTADFTLTAKNHNIQLRGSDSDGYYSKIHNMLTMNVSYSDANIAPYFYSIYGNDADNPTTGGINLESGTTMDLFDGENYPNRFKITSNSATLTFNAITITYSC